MTRVSVTIIVCERIKNSNLYINFNNGSCGRLGGDTVALHFETTDYATHEKRRNRNRIKLAENEPAIIYDDQRQTRT